MFHPQDPIRGKLLLGYHQQLLAELKAHGVQPRGTVRAAANPKRNQPPLLWHYHQTCLRRNT